jgi:hypothetical protein
VFGCAYHRIADEECSATTLRDRRDEWIEIGAMDALREIVLEAYGRYIGLDLADLAVDGCTTKAPCEGEKAGVATDGKAELPADHNLSAQPLSQLFPSDSLKLLRWRAVFRSFLYSRLCRVGWFLVCGLALTLHRDTRRPTIATISRESSTTPENTATITSSSRQATTKTTATGTAQVAATRDNRTVISSSSAARVPL